MKWLVLSVFTLIFWVVLYLYLYLGFFKSVDVRVGEMPGFVLVYKDHIGPYHQINESLKTVEEALYKKGFPCSKTFGEFLDDPNEISEDRLRSHVGCAFDKKGGQLSVAEEKIRKVSKDLGYQFDFRRAKSAVVAKFQGSPAIGPFKVYPKMEEVILDQRLAKEGPVIEVYEVQGDEVLTTYYQPLADHQTSD